MTPLAHVLLTVIFCSPANRRLNVSVIWRQPASGINAFRRMIFRLTHSGLGGQRQNTFSSGGAFFYQSGAGVD
jgi:hypothetical protein